MKQSSREEKVMEQSTKPQKVQNFVNVIKPKREQTGQRENKFLSDNTKLTIKSQTLKIKGWKKIYRAMPRKLERLYTCQIQQASEQ